MSQTTQDEVRCPKCKSQNLHAEKRGWNIWTGLILSGKIVITCLACGHKFAPGQGSVTASQPPAPQPIPRSGAPIAVPKKPSALYTGIDKDDSGIPKYTL